MATLTGGWMMGPVPRGDRPMAIERRVLALWFPFVLVFLLVGVTGLAWVWQRSAIYESSALVKIVEQSGTGSVVAERAETMLLHQQLLTSQQLLQLLSERMTALGATVSPDQLRDLLSVTVLADSRLLRLVAVGTDPQRLEPLLREWELLYRERFLQQQQSDQQSRSQQLAQRLTLLEQQREQQQLELQAYQRVHSIVSIERDENRVLNRIRGLAESLDQASTQRQQAQAELGAIGLSLRRGEAMVRPQDQPGIDNLERRAAELADQLQALAERFTPRYMAIDSRAIALQHRLTQAREAVAERRRDSANMLRQQAQRKLDARLSEERVLQQELDDQNELVRQFSDRMNELAFRRQNLDALESDIVRLRTELQHISIAPEPRLGFIQIAPPYTPTRPSYPDYWRDSVVVMLLALATACLSVLLMRLLHPEARPQIILQQAAAADRQERVVASEERLLQPVSLFSGRRVSTATCRALLARAEPQTRLLLMLLLSGVHLREIPSLGWYHLEPEGGLMTVPSLPPRDIPLPDALCRLLAGEFPPPDNRLLPLLADGDGHPLSPDVLEEMIQRAAVKAGLADPGALNSALLEHSYMLFLVEQGVRHQQLELQLGPLPPDLLDPIEACIESAPERLLDEVNRVHPALV